MLEKIYYCEKNLLGNSGGYSEDQNADRNMDSTTVLTKFQMRMRALLGIGLEAIYIIFW